MKHMILVSLFLLITNMVFAAALPKSWYLLPEEGLSKVKTNKVTEPSVKMKQATQRLFTVHTETLKDFPAIGSQLKLKGLSLDLGLSHSGKLGILPFQGTAVATGHWRKQSVEQKAVKSDEDKDRYYITADMQRTELLSLAKFIHHLLLKNSKSRGDIISVPAIFELINEFKDLAMALEQSPHPYWSVDHILYDRSVRSSVKKGLVTTGADLLIRLGWKIGSSTQVGSPQTYVARQGSLNKLTRQIADELTLVSLAEATSFQPNKKYKLKGFSMGLGIAPNLNYGLASFGGSIVAHVGFKRNKTEIPKNWLPSKGLSKFNYYVSKLNRKEKQYLIKNNISHADLGDSLAVEVSLANFRKGISFAYKMGSWLGRQGGLSGAGQWGLERIDTSYKMGLGGDIVLSKLKGSSTFKLVLEKEESAL